ncbi:helix-turn-helix transcriptional regulator [Frigidibacter sp. MR17.14]|uniref:helix-turn-helix transcriptional regulator n=1 Tax=Frigidibacter sp. MR17.14 TaxID=3126509 RepID=UPI003012C83C
MHSRLVATVQRAALQPSAWAEVIAEIEAASGDARAFAFRLGAHGQQPVETLIGSFEPEFVALHQEMLHLNPWAPTFASLPNGRALLAREMVDESIVERGEFYQDWVRPQGDVIAGSAMKVAGRGGVQLLLGANIRRDARERSEPRLLAALQALAPHLQHALDVNEAMAERASRLLRAEAQVSGASWLIGLDLQGRVSWMDHDVSPAVLALFSLDWRGVLRFRDRGVTDWLALCLATRRRAPPGGRAPPLRRDLGQGALRFRLRLVPVAPGDLPGIAYHSGTYGDPGLALIVTHLAPRMDLRAVLAQRYGMTAAEAEVSVRLARGERPAEIAEARQVSIHTVRNQLKIAMSKVDVQRAVELVRVVLKLDA